MTVDASGETHSSEAPSLTSTDVSHITSEEAKITSDEESTEALPIELGSLLAGVWQLNSVLGRGGFGVVYRARCLLLELDNEAAVKVEVRKRHRRDRVMKLELAVLCRLQGKSHACRLLGAGIVDNNQFIAMSLVGQDLDDLRHLWSHKRFSISTATRLGLQCLEAIADVHSVGVLHRDVKPSNFAMGCSDVDRNNVYILDFGMARCYTRSDGELRSLRDRAGFRGTVRYASIRTLQHKDMWRVDDLWSWFYMLVEMYRGNLPWRKVEKRSANLHVKSHITAKELLHGCPPELERLYDQLHGMKHRETPDYARMVSVLRGVMKRRAIEHNDPWDWDYEGGKECERINKPATV